MLVAWLSTNASVDVGLDGHADQPDSESAALVARRVRVVRDALIAGGVAAGRIHVGEFGDRVAVCTTGPTCQELNRRVEVLVTTRL
jgi:outer membrane protein OmpA-like peptidoglycan-associated protein